MNNSSQYNQRLQNSNMMDSSNLSNYSNNMQTRGINSNINNLNMGSIQVQRNDTFGQQVNVAQVLQQMANKISESASQIRTIQEFFIPYDAFEGRIFEAWEIEIIFTGYIQIQEAEALVQQLSQEQFQTSLSSSVIQKKGIDCQTLINSLSQYMRHLAPGKSFQTQSVFAQKQSSLTSSIKGYLNQIQNSINQMGGNMDLKTGFGMFFKRSFIDENEFSDFLNRIRINLYINDFDFKSLFSYFKIQNESMISLIGLVQGMKQFIDSSRFMSNNIMDLNTQTPEFNQNPKLIGINNNNNQTIQFLINQINNLMKKGLSFEGFLNQQNIPNSIYMSYDQLFDMCQRLGISITQDTKRELVFALDYENTGKIKIEYLRQQLQNSNTSNNIPQLRLGGDITISTNSKQIPNEGILKIRQWMQQTQMLDLSKIFTHSFLKGKVVIDFQEFLTFLSIPDINLNQRQSFELAAKYMLDTQIGKSGDDSTNQYYIDLEALENDIKEGIQSTRSNLNKKSMASINLIYEEIRKHIMTTNGNIYKVFQQIDTDNDGLISKNELFNLISNLGFKNVTLEDVDNIYHYLDTNKDGSLQISDLVTQFANNSNIQAIKDPSHWAFYIFDNIRRALSINQISLAQLFGINEFSIQTLQDKCFISKDQFLNGLSRLQIPLLFQQTDSLLQLLGADKMNNFQINFVKLQELVGLNQVNQNIGNYTKEYISNPYDSMFAQKCKTFYRSLNDVMQSKNIQLNYLKLILRESDPQNSGYILYQDFQIKLQSIDQNKIINFSNLSEITNKFKKGAQYIDYTYFLKNLEIEIEKYKLINYIFLFLDVAIKSQQVQNLAELLLKLDKGQSQTTTFSKEMLQNSLKALGLQIRPDELDLILVEYDISGSGIKLDFKTFNDDFEQFRQGVSQLNNYIKERDLQYNQFFQKSQEYNIDLKNIHINQKYGTNNNNNNIVSNNINNMNQMNMMQSNMNNQASKEELFLWGKISSELDNNNLKAKQLIDLLRENDITKNGIINQNDFSQILQTLFRFNMSDIQTLIRYYTTFQQTSIIIHDFLTNISDLMQNQQSKTSIVFSIQEFKNINLQQKTGGITQQQSLQKYVQQFEEIMKAIIARESDTVKYFQQVSFSKSTLSKQEFVQALINLNLKSASIDDINKIYQQLDQFNNGSIDISVVDQTIRDIVKKSGQELSNDIIERILREFNGDDSYILQQLIDLDRGKKGKINKMDFVQFLIKSGQIFENDIQFISLNYINPRINKNELDYNNFHTDLVRIKNKLGMQGSQYYQNNDNRQMINKGIMNNALSNVGTNNSFFSNYTKNNTKSGQSNSNIRPPIGFRVNIQQNLLDDLIKGTVVQGKLIQDYFSEYINLQQQFINQNIFQTAIKNLGLDWTQNQCQSFFNEIDRAFNQNLTKMVLSPEQIDMTVHFQSQKTTDDIQNQIIQSIAQFIATSGINIRSQIQQFDLNSSKMVSVNNMKDILLNKIYVKDITQIDVVFICMKYIQSMPNMVHYEKLLEDLEKLFVSKYQIHSDFFVICEVIRKMCLLNSQQFEEYLTKFMKRNRDLIFQDEFEKAIQQLGLIPEYCTVQQIQTMFNEIDISKLGKVTLPQVQNYMDKITPQKQAKEYQDQILKNIITITQSKNLIIDNIFIQEDQIGKGIVSYNIFEQKLINVLQIKKIDVILLSRKYMEMNVQGGNNQLINYKNMILDLYQLDKSLGQQQKMQISQQQMPPDQRVQEILKKIGEVVLTKNIQLSREFQQYERGNSNIDSLPQNIFYTIFKNIGIVLLSSEISRLNSFYGVQQQLNVSQNQQDIQIRHRKFLEDLKMYGSNRKPVESLTQDQKNLYQALGEYIKKCNLQAPLIQQMVNQDADKKGFLMRPVIEQVFAEHKLTVNKIQFDTMLGVVNQNQRGHPNYKQMIEYLFGVEDANKLFIAASQSQQKQTNINQQQDEQLFKLVIPQKPINPMNMVLGEIGNKIIRSSKNIEEELKKKLGNFNNSTINLLRIPEKDIIDLLKNCQVQLTQDENVQLQAFVIHSKDQNGMVLLNQLLQAIGIPLQSVSLASVLPKKILTNDELKISQNIIFQLRNELTKLNKRPQDIFEKHKKQITEKSFKQQLFRMSLLSECGQIGKSLQNDDITLLTYYLQEETQGEISYNKLYLAFTLLEKDPPLKQYGIEQIKKYEENLKKQMSLSQVPLEIIDLLHFINENNLNIEKVFKLSKGQISRQNFEMALKQIGFMHRNLNGIMDNLSVQGSRTAISLDKLQSYANKIMNTASKQGTTMTPQMARDLYQKFDPKVRQQLQKISEFLKREGISLQRLYEEMDSNQDGTVDKKEFVTKIATMNIAGVFPSDLGLIYDQIDMNGDGVLSINEFGMYLEGAKSSKMQRLQDLNPKIIEEMRQEILVLFKSFDEDNNGFVTPEEIYKSMLALGQKVTVKEAQEMISTVDKNGDGKLDQNEFIKLLLPKMKEDLMKQEDNVEDLRALFMEADIDHSGTLSIDELYSVILKMGAEVTMDELVEMMNEIDVDRNGNLDIDEFVALMNMGDEIQFRSNVSKNTLLNIKRVRKLNPMDFFKQFKNMPQSFIPSFFNELWVKQRKNLPSSEFVPQLDPKTMLYKDLLSPLQDNFIAGQNSKAYCPRIRPNKTQIGCQILLEGAEGVPIPKGGQDFNRNQIVKRSVRIGLFDTTNKCFIHNSVQINALYNSTDEDIWKFNEWKENGMNPFLFKTTNKEQICKGNVYLIFELVVNVKFGDKIVEMSCGWCQLNANMLDRQMTHKLQIKGGSPNSELLIKGTDVHTNRSGIKYIMKVVQSHINSQLSVVVRPYQKFTEETKFHLDLLPSTCLVNKRLLYFVSGFRNYIGDKLLKDTLVGSYRQPEGDVIISMFPKILDSPDICETLIKVWADDVWVHVKGKAKLNVEFVMLKTKDFIQRLYPVIYSTEFKYKESNPSESASGDQYLMKKREDLLQSALRYGQQNTKVKITQPIESHTSFKPFTVRELEFEVWDTSKAKQDKYLKQYDELGLLSGGENYNQNMNNSNLALIK